MTIPYAVDLWINGGFPASKIALGMATYGRSFRLSSVSRNGLGARTAGAGDAGTYTGEGGILAFYEICGMQLNVVNENRARASYGFRGQTWVCFDNEESLRYKVTSLIKSKFLF